MRKPKLHLGNLEGEEGNAFVILGRAQAVAKENGLDNKAIQAEATSGDYEHLLATMKKYYEVTVKDILGNIKELK